MIYTVLCVCVSQSQPKFSGLKLWGAWLSGTCAFAQTVFLGVVALFVCSKSCLPWMWLHFEIINTKIVAFFKFAIAFSFIMFCIWFEYKHTSARIELAKKECYYYRSIEPNGRHCDCIQCFEKKTKDCLNSSTNTNDGIQIICLIMMRFSVRILKKCSASAAI